MKLSKDGEPDLDATKPYQDKFKAALDNDLNTSLAITALYDVLKGKIDDATKRYLIADFDRVLSLGLLEAADRELQKAAAAEAEKAALQLKALEEKGLSKEWVEKNIAARAAAKAEKNWAEADRIRDELLAKGIVIKDSKDGATWELNS